MMRSVIKRPGQRALVVEIDPSLASIQEIVGGYVEQVMGQPDFFNRDRLVVYGNEDGLRLALPFNMCRPSGHVLIGILLALKVDETGENVAMTIEDAERVRQLFNRLSPSTDV